MKNKFIIGAMAILVGLSVGIVLSSDQNQNVQRAAVVGKPVLPSLSSLVDSVKRSVEGSEAIKNLQESWNQAKVRGVEIGKQAVTQGKKIVEQAKLSGRDYLVNQILPIFVTAGQDIANEVSVGLSQAAASLVQQGTTKINNLTLKSVQGIQSVTTSAVQWINKNVDPEKAKLAAAQIEQQAAAAVQGVVGEGKDVLEATAHNIADAAKLSAQQPEGFNRGYDASQPVG